MSYFKNIGIGIDQLINTLIGGQPDETISAKAFREGQKGKLGWIITERIINLVFLDDSHCCDAYQAELLRTQISDDYRK